MSSPFTAVEVRLPAGGETYLFFMEISPMLVLSRKAKQVITIGDDIRVEVLEIKGNTVRLGLVAPREVSIVRDELERKPKCDPKKQ